MCRSRAQWDSKAEDQSENEPPSKKAHLTHEDCPFDEYDPDEIAKMLEDKAKSEIFRR